MDPERWQRLSPLLDALFELDEDERTRSLELMREEDLPPTSGAVRARFNVACHAPDFWNDPAAQARASGRAFAGEITGFEARFRAKTRPIHYVELRAKPL